MAITAAPTLVFGALRSGTTLFRIMLNAHPQLGNPGEADFLFDFIHPDPTHPTGWRYDIEAMQGHRIYQRYGFAPPAQDCDGLDLLEDMLRHLQSQVTGHMSLNIHRHIDRAAQLLPQAKIIHLLRDPRDVARSSIGMGWAGNSYHGAYHWMETMKGWLRAANAISPDRVLTITFEGLMADLDTELSKVCQFLDVTFDPIMLTYHKSGTYGPPDPSIAQQWKHKASAHEVALIEGRCGPLLEQAGYTPNGAPAIPGTLETLWLNTDNRVRRWRYNIRRYGLTLFVSNHVTRVMGLRRLNTQLRGRMTQYDIEALK